MTPLRLTLACMRDWKCLTPDVKRKLEPFIDRLLMEEGGLDIKRLHGLDRPVFRLRVGDYRVLFVRNAESVTLVRIAHRKDVYRD